MNDDLCETCKVPEHDQCPLTEDPFDPNCRCCRETMDQLQDLGIYL